MLDIRIPEPILGVRGDENELAEDNSMKIKTRLGVGPDASGGRKTCPDFYELESGEFVVIGRDVTEAFSTFLPADASMSPNERAVLVPRIIITSARSEIPNE